MNFFDFNQNISELIFYKVTVMSGVVFTFVMWGANLNQFIQIDRCSNHYPHTFLLLPPREVLESP